MPSSEAIVESARSPSITVAPGSTVIVRDALWQVTSTEQTQDGLLVRAQGVSDLVRDTSAVFFERLDTITPLDPSQARVVADDSPGFQRARLWLDARTRILVTCSPSAVAQCERSGLVKLEEAIDRPTHWPIAADAATIRKLYADGGTRASASRRDHLLVGVPRCLQVVALPQEVRNKLFSWKGASAAWKC